jgi:hypothetical protein
VSSSLLGLGGLVIKNSISYVLLFIYREEGYRLGMKAKSS